MNEPSMQLNGLRNFKTVLSAHKGKVDGISHIFPLPLRKLEDMFFKTRNNAFSVGLYRQVFYSNVIVLQSCVTTAQVGYNM